MKIDPNAPARLTPAQIDAAVEAQAEALIRARGNSPSEKRILANLLRPDALRALLSPEAGACKNCNRPKGEHKRGFCVHEFGIGPSSYCAPSNPEKTGLCPHGWAGHCVHCRTGIHATPEVPGSEYDTRNCIHGNPGNCCDKCEEGSPELSPYDKAVEALAGLGLIPDGYFAHGESPHSFRIFSNKPVPAKDGDWTWKLATGMNTRPLPHLSPIPRCPDWRASLRRIEKGKVTQ